MQVIDLHNHVKHRPCPVHDAEGLLNVKDTWNNNAPAIAVTSAQIEKARNEYTDRIGAAAISNRFLSFWALCSTLMSVALVIAIVVMMPLKQTVPYTVEVNKTTGEVRAVGEAVVSKNYIPGEAERTYWLAQFAELVMGIDPRKDVTSDRIERASAIVRGKAGVQLGEYLRKTTPLRVITEDPNFSRRVTVRAVNFIRGANTASIQLRVVDQTLDRPAVERFYIIKADYAFVQPAGLQEITRNPLGMYVIDFVINEDAR
jgi:type IV secretion system protein VirB8